MIIVDAWEKNPFNNCPRLKKDADAFCHFLDRVCEIERKRRTLIIHSCVGKSVNKNITIKEKDILMGHANLHSILLENNIKNAYFCGFHFRRCIHHAYAESSRPDGNIKLGIVINLCMVYPGDLWNLRWTFQNASVDPNFRDKGGKKNPNMGGKNFLYYMWSNLGFEEFPNDYLVNENYTPT